MKHTQRNTTGARRLLKNLFLNERKKITLTEVENKEYDEYLEYYRSMTRWQTL